MDHPAEFLKTHLKFSPKWRWVLMVHLDADASSSVQNDKWQKWPFKIKILFSNPKFYFFAYTFFCYNQKMHFLAKTEKYTFPPKPQDVFFRKKM